MELLLIVAAMLLCPLVMGGVMVWMMRTMHRSEHQRDAH
jgi:hypothetical protein